MSTNPVQMDASTPTTATPAPEPQRPAGSTAASAAWLGSQSIFDRRDENALKRAAGATGVTLAFYGVLLTLLLIGGITVSQQIINPQEEMPKFVYLNDPGPGGGGGGSPAPAPPKPMEVPKHKAPDPIPEPVVTPPPPPPIPTLNAPIETSLANVLQATGSNSVSLASYGGGGSGGGIGSGRGNGVGPGTGGGFGGGAFHPGNGILPPSLIHQVEPKYTSDAMRAKVQGDVELEAVILPNGTVGDVHITKSLDDKFGLDQEAIKAAKQWTFRPGTDRDGKAQPVIVTLILSFRLH